MRTAAGVGFLIGIGLMVLGYLLAFPTGSADDDFVVKMVFMTPGGALAIFGGGWWVRLTVLGWFIRFGARNWETGRDQYFGRDRGDRSQRLEQ